MHKNQLLNCPALSDALEICEIGLTERLAWDAQNLRYIKVKNETAAKCGIGKMVGDFLRRTKTVVIFTKGFGSQSKTGGAVFSHRAPQHNLLPRRERRLRNRFYAAVFSMFSSSRL